jgi:hypothetical protein
VVLYTTTDANATVTTSFVTGKPPYPDRALLFNGDKATTLRGRMVQGEYRYTFNDGSFGAAVLAFIEPRNAHLGTVTVKSSAAEACGAASSTTTYTVKKDEPNDKSGKDDLLPDVMSSMSFTLPGSDVLPSSTAKAAHIHVLHTARNGATILVITVPRSDARLNG